MYDDFNNLLNQHNSFCVIQAENPDGDSLGSALALEEILSDADKTISLYCPVDIPKYLRYFSGWDRITTDFDFKANAYIIVDTASAVLLSKLLNDSAIKNRLEHSPVFVLDHHETPPDLPFASEQIIEPSVATAELIFKIFEQLKYPINPTAATDLLSGILSDTLGLSSQSVSADTYRTSANLIDLGASVWEIEEARREYMRKSPRILDYKADLIKRVEYHLDGKLATVHINWDDIREYSDEYNPNVLILEELRLVEGVEVAVAIKTYPDGKLTGKIRTTKPIAEQLAGYFGGGGHAYAAGFRIYEDYDTSLNELISATDKLLSAL
jgi:phosphoesterase RecJ-like protein